VTDGPGYERMADALRHAILAGDLAGRLPSLDALARQYAVTRDVARRAVDILRGEGLVVSFQGKGTYVRVFERITRRSPGRLARPHWSAGQQIQDHDTGLRPRTADVVVGDVPAPDFVAEALGVAEGEPVLFRSRRFLVERRPVQLATSYLPMDLATSARLMFTDTGPGGIYARLAELGHAPVRFTERVTGRSPRPDEVERLEMSTAVGTIVFEITRYAYAESGRCVEVNRMILDCAAYEVVYDFDA
jgi:GntR family transcriptional regulator